MGLPNPPEGRREVPLYYSNPDIIYANEFPAPRFGQGCFAAALNAVYTAVCHLLACLTFFMHAAALNVLRNSKACSLHGIVNSLMPASAVHAVHRALVLYTTGVEHASPLQLP